MTKNQRIAIIGPESSGKTTLANALGETLNWQVISEYAREYFSDKDYSKCSINDLINIAEKQYEITHAKELQTPLIADTEIITIEIWAEDKFKQIPDRIIQLRKAQKFDLYILSLPDIEWQYDPLRSDADRREIIYKKYLKFLEISQLKFIIVQGDTDNRLNQCLKFINNTSE
jgi:nicotinamide riboside kinase